MDQRRGLLREIEETSTCSPQALVDWHRTNLCGQLRYWRKLTSTNPEELVAASSYLPFMGKLTAEMKEEGIVALDIAFMEIRARRVVV